jgi:arylsulfatase A-like enzyme
VLQLLLASLCALGSGACHEVPPASGPSILLFVMDTTRADAVSAYGRVSGTTPTLDGLARDGLLYAHAFASAPWTLPSHATLFSGLPPAQHGVGWRRPRVPDDLRLLAERLRDAGYDTFGFSENVWVSDYFNLAQGFQKFVSYYFESRAAPEAPASAVADALGAWLGRRRGDRPFFVFVNVIDAHSPYRVRAENLFLPPGISGALAASIPQGPESYLCRAPRRGALQVLRGLYLGDVRSADEKLASVLALLRAAPGGERLVSVVTADHGELLGEGGLVGHQFSLRNELLQVPLVVNGLPGIAPAVVETPVQLADVVPSVLAWAGLPADPSLPGLPLPTGRDAKPPPRAFVALFRDPDDPAELEDSEIARGLRDLSRRRRQHCDPNGPVFGDFEALIQFPLKLVRSGDRPPALFDLAADPDERHDLAAERPALAAALANELAALDTTAPPSEAGSKGEVPKDVLKGLRALGYLEDEGSAAPSAGAPER